MTSVGPRIVAVLVTHDGAPMLREAVTSIAAQTRPGIELYAVDNASDDGTAELLVELVGPDRVVLSDVDLGFPAAVDLALDAVDAEDARLGRSGPHEDDLVLLLHDDLRLERDAVERLAAVLDADDRVAIVGPKLRWADDPTRLQSVGATIDLTGRVDDGLDPDERDQGQRDGDRRVLFVPTAGMLLRRRVFDELGRFDPRGHAFREDLDLCWRAAVAGHDVEVVPSAVGLHAARSAEHLRSGRVAQLGPRFLAERNTLAAILTNYGPQRLLVVLPLALMVGVAKVAGFLLTRRIGDARDTVAAWGWNLVNLPGTLRRRRHAQRLRRRSDTELAPLLGKVTPRLRAYLEAVLDRIVGDAAAGELGSAENQPSATLQGELDGRTAPDRWAGSAPDDDEVYADAADVDAADGDASTVQAAEGAEDDEDVAGVVLAEPVADVADEVALVGAGPEADLDDGSAGPDGERRVRRVLAALAGRAVRRPLQVLLPPALVLLAVGLRELLLPSAVRGGDLVPFPSGDGLITRHLAAWHDSGQALSALDPSPAQLVLGLVQAAGGDGALRALVVLVPLLAWVGAMRALAPHVTSPLQRTVLGLAYAASPPALTALASGDLATLVAVALVPPIVLTLSTVLDRSAEVGRVWRRMAVAVTLLAVLVAFVPGLVVVLPLVALAGVGHALVAVADTGWRRTLVLRSVLVALLPLPLLGPWLTSLPDVLREGLAGTAVPVGGHPGTWVLLDPTGRIAGVAGVALVLAGIAGALVIAVATVGPTTFRASVAMLAVGLGSPLVAWWLDAAGTSLRTGPLLVVAAGAHVGLAGLGLTHLPAVLSAHPFGWRQVGAALTAVVTVVMTAAGLVHHAVSGTPGLTRDEAIPAYLATLSPFPPARVLVVGGTDDGIVWEVVPATGPDLAAFGVRHDPALDAAITAAVDDLLSGRDPRAAARLGRLGVGVVLVPDGLEDPLLDLRLRSQTALDPLPSLVGTVSRVVGGVPGAAVVRDVSAAERVPDPTVPPRVVVAAVPGSGDRFAGTSGPGGDLVAAVPFGAGWQVLVDGAPFPLLSDDGLVRARDLPAGVDVEVVPAGSADRDLLLRAQALWAVLLVSLGARPPAFARRNARRRELAERADEADEAADVEPDVEPDVEEGSA